MSKVVETKNYFLHSFSINIQGFIAFFLISTVFVIPISATLKSVFIIPAIFLILLHISDKKLLQFILKKTWAISSILLFCFALISSIWSPATFSEKILILEKYFKLIYLPVLVLGFMNKRSRNLALHAFLAAMVITTLVSIFKYFNWSYYHGVDPGHVFHNHIMTGFMVALAAYLSLIFAVQNKNKKIYIFLAILFSIQVIFINTGRTGYVIFSFLIFLFLLQQLSLRHACAAFLIFVVFAGTIYVENTTVNTRVNQIALDWKNYKKDHEDNSLSYRLQFHQFAKQLFLKSPIIGNGIASFTNTFAKVKPVPSWNRRLLEPHSQYWLIASELGLVGIFLFICFLFSLIKEFLCLVHLRQAALGVLGAFLIANLTDSFIFYSGTGYLFIVMMALFLGESLSMRINREMPLKA